MAHSLLKKTSFQTPSLLRKARSFLATAADTSRLEPRLMEAVYLSSFEPYLPQSFLKDSFAQKPSEWGILFPPSSMPHSRTPAVIVETKDGLFRIAENCGAVPKDENFNRLVKKVLCRKS